MSNEKARIDMLRTMMKSDPNDPFFQYALALEYYALGEHHQALEMLQDLQRSQSNYLPTYYQLGQFLTEQNQPEEAIQIYRQGVALAKILGEQKTLGELNTALLMLDADE
jgi:tetratricopeptide (TPR) repeat protein